MKQEHYFIDLTSNKHECLELSSDKCYNHSGCLAPRLKEVRKMTEPKNVSATLQVDRGIYVIRGRVYDPVTGETKHKSKSTHLRVRDKTKRKAEQELKDAVEQWTQEANAEVVYGDPLFSEYVNRWIDKKRLSLKANSVKSYEDYANCHILPKLGKLHVLDMSLKHLQLFYKDLLKDLSVLSVRKIHVVVSGALLDAVRDGIISVNFAEYVEFPKAKKFEGATYDASQVAILLDGAAKEGEPIRAAVTLAVCYGLRRSEIVGLRWSDIDFEKKTLCVRNTVVQNGELLIEEERTKTAKSHRIIILLDSTIPYLKSLKERHKICGIKSDKVCVWPDGREVRPDFLTYKIPKLMKECGLPVIRVHDLRHTAATLLASVATPKQVQEFLGHEDISTTMNVYTHILDKDRIATSSLYDGLLGTVSVCSGICSGIQNQPQSVHNFLPEKVPET